MSFLSCYKIPAFKSMVKYESIPSSLSYVDELPKDVLIYLLKFLDAKALLQMKAVCRKMNSIVRKMARENPKLNKELSQEFKKKIRNQQLIETQQLREAREQMLLKLKSSVILIASPILYTLITTGSIITCPCIIPASCNIICEQNVCTDSETEPCTEIFFQTVKLYPALTKKVSESCANLRD